MNSVPNNEQKVQGSDTTVMPQSTTAGIIKIIFAKQRVINVLPLLLFFISTYSFSQQPLQLNDAINIALKNSLDIQVAKNNLEINEVNNTYGVAGGLPVVTGTASNQRQITNVNQSLNTRYSYSTERRIR